MNKIFIFFLTAVTVLCSCSNGNHNTDELAFNGNESDDTTLCQFSNIKINKMYSYCDEDRDTTYFDNTFTALWPIIINGKPCDELQQALFRAMTDSAELNQLDLVADFLLNPASYTDCDINRLTPVKAVKADESKLSTSEVNVVMERMTDRLLTYRLSTYSYMAGGAHGIYANNYVTYDLDSCKAVDLADVVADTTLLRSAILKSIKHTYNYGTDDLFIPDNGLLPLPRDFFIEDHVLHAVYQVYEIASYAQGAIDAPIYPYMLKPEEMKRLFTPYGLQLIDY
jgi:hypothetical protein